jgi:hypothetical protein
VPCGGSSLELFMGDDKKKNPVYKKNQGWKPITRSIRQIKVREHMSPMNITISTSLIH